MSVNDTTLTRGAALVLARLEELADNEANLERIQDTLRTIEDRDGVVLVRSVGSRVEGMVAGIVQPHPWRRSTYAHLCFWVVDKELRGQGIGRSLLGNFEKWAVDRGATSILAGGMKGSMAHRLLQAESYMEIETFYNKEMR